MSKELKSELELLEFLEDRDKLPSSWITFWSFESGQYSCGACMVDGENISTPESWNKLSWEQVDEICKKFEDPQVITFVTD